MVLMRCSTRRLEFFLSVYDLDAEHVEESPEVVDGAVPSVDDGSEFFALDETELDISATEEALDKLLWHEFVEDATKHITTRWERQWCWPSC